MSRRLLVPAVIGFASMAATAAAQHAPEWGTSTASVLTVPFTQFTKATVSYSQLFGSIDGTDGGTCQTLGSECYGHGAASLPTGARLIGLELDVCDSEPTGEAGVKLFHCPVNSFACTQVATVESGVVATPGCTLIASVPFNLTVQNAAAYLGLIARVQIGGAPVYFRAARLRYQLQVSPAPAVATFPNDVPTTHPIFRFVEALAAAGISGGCGPGSFCPDAPLTRGQMAVFLAVALGLHFPN